MKRETPILRPLASLMLAALLILSPVVVGFAADASAVSVGTLDELRAILEAPGTGHAAIVAGSVIVDENDTIVVAGNKTLTIHPECALELYGSIEIPRDASLTVAGSGYTYVEVYEGTGFDVAGRLRFEDNQLQLFAGGPASAIVNTGGELIIEESVVLMSLGGNAAGIRNAGSFQMRGGLFYLASQGFEQGYISVGFYNDSGTAAFDGAVLNFVNVGSNYGVVNNEGEMTFTGGTFYIGNYYGSSGVLNGDAMHFTDMAIYLDSAGQSGIDNFAGAMSFTGCTLEFLSAEGSAANLYNSDAGTIDINSSAIVVYTDAASCIENASGTVRDNGRNSLLRISDAPVLTSHDGATMDTYADTYYYLNLSVNADGVRIYEDAYTLSSAWPGHVVYLISGDQLVPVTPIKTSGETLVIRADGYGDTRYKAPAATQAQPGSTLTITLAEVSSAGIYLGALTLVLAVASVFLQQKYGKTFVRPVKRKVAA